MDAIVRDAKERIERGSKSFAGAARLFKPEVRDDAYMLYAWCRYCDDVVDGQLFGFYDTAGKHQDSLTPTERLAHLRERTIEAINGRATDPVFIALGRVVSKHQIPTRHPMALLDGFAMDVEERTFNSLYDTLDYCYHVAGVVGVMMTMIMGARDHATLLRAADLGIAFQLTNISRDVAEDAAMGRVYIPKAWLSEAGLSNSDLLNPAKRDAVAAVVRILLETAETYYRSAGYGIRALPLRSAWAIAAAKQIYRAIGLQVKRKGAKAWEERVIITKSQKYLTVATSLAEATYLKTFGRFQSAPARSNLWTKADLREGA